MLKILKISFLDIIFRHILGKYTLLLLLLYTKLMTKHHRNSFEVFSVYDLTPAFLRYAVVKLINRFFKNKI